MLDTEQVTAAPSILLFQGRVGDRNDSGFEGARDVAAGLAMRLGSTPIEVGRPARPQADAALDALSSARRSLRELSRSIRGRLGLRRPVVTVLPRCAGAFATVPEVLSMHPPVRLLWIDAHADCNSPQSSSTGYLGGMTLSGLAGLWPTGVEPVLDLGQVCLIGARDFDPAEQTILATHAVPVIEATSHMPADIRDFIGDEMVYVHVDCDVLDIPYTSTEVPVPRGMTPQELFAALTALPSSQLLGIEVAEWQSDPQLPQYREILDTYVEVLASAVSGSDRLEH